MTFPTIVKHRELRTAFTKGVWPELITLLPDNESRQCYLQYTKHQLQLQFPYQSQIFKYINI